MKVIENAGGKARRKSAWAMIVAACVIAGGGLYYWKTRPAAQTATRQAPAIPVTVAAAENRSVPIYLDVLGTVSASNTVAIRSQVTGTLQAVNFTEGQEVHQGDTLAT